MSPIVLRSCRPRTRSTASVGVALLALVAAPVAAGTLVAEVTAGGEPVANAVVHARPLDGQSLAREEAPTAVMDQRDREFVPHVLPVRRGTSVRFPNSDETRHHVYSFSEARTFELRLYAGTDAEPVEFDRTGVVTLGCNIHDWMLGYILVLDTPAFARTSEAGRARLADLPPGRYRLTAWHPRLRDDRGPTRRVTVTTEGTTETTFALDLRPPRERPSRGFGGREDDEAREGFDRD